MDSTSFYKGMLHELTKIAAINPPQQPKPLWKKMLPYGLGAGAAALGGYGLYKHFNQPQAQSPTTTASNPVVHDMLRRVAASGYHGEMESPDAQGIGQVSGVANSGQLATDLGLGAGAVANKLTSGKVGTGLLGKATGMANAVFNKNILPETMSTSRFTPRIGGVLTALPNIYDINKNNDVSGFYADPDKHPYGNMAVKDLLSVGDLAASRHPVGMIGNIAASTARGLTDQAGREQNRFSDNLSGVSDVLLGLHRGMADPDPQTAEQYRQAAQYFLNNKTLSDDWAGRVANPSFLERAAANNYGLTGLAGKASPNTGPIQSLLARVRREAGVQ